METHQTEPKRAVRWLSAVLLFGAILAVMFPAGAWAVGTEANTVISNTATIVYVVGEEPITVESSPSGNSTVGENNGVATTFLVDRVVDLTVSRTGEAYTTGIAGDTVVLTFKVTNTGNDTFAFNLEGIDLEGVADPYNVDGTDNLDGVGVVNFYLDADESGAYEEDSDTLWATTYTFAPDAEIYVHMVCDVPDTAAEGAIAVMLLRATALDSNGDEMAKDSGEDVTDSVQTVFADADTDGDGTYDDLQDARAVATDVFQVQAPNLTVTKTSEVQYDPINGTDNPMAIPSARVRYTIVIANGGSTAASGLVVTDAIPEDTWFHVGSITVDPETDDTATYYSTDSGTDYSTYTPTEETTGDDGEDQSVTNIMVNVGTIAASESTTVTFDVIIR